MRLKVYLVSFVSALLSQACVSVPNTTACSVAGNLSAGMICAETLSSRTYSLSLDQTIDFLEPKIGQYPRAGAICQSAVDWNKQKTALELACRELGNRCSYEVQDAIRKIRANGL